jgi:hypothetical protein
MMDSCQSGSWSTARPVAGLVPVEAAAFMGRQVCATLGRTLPFWREATFPSRRECFPTCFARQYHAVLKPCKILGPFNT